MKFPSWLSLSRKTKKFITETMAHQAFMDFDHPDIDRVLIAGAVVTRDQGHWSIESGAETDEDLAQMAQRILGHCDCGAPLSNRDTRFECRSCGREYRI